MFKGRFRIGFVRRGTGETAGIGPVFDAPYGVGSRTKAGEPGRINQVLLSGVVVDGPKFERDLYGTELGVLLISVPVPAEAQGVGADRPPICQIEVPAALVRQQRSRPIVGHSVTLSGWVNDSGIRATAFASEPG